MTLSLVQEIQYAVQPVNSLASAALPLELTATTLDRAFFRPGDAWRVNLSIANRGAAASAPVVYSASVTGPNGRRRELMRAQQVPMPVAAGYTSGQFAAPLSAAGGYVFTPSDPAGRYTFAFQATTRQGEVLGSACCCAEYSGAGYGTAVKAGLAPSSSWVDLGQTLAVTASLANVSGRAQLIKIAIVAQYTGPDGPGEPVMVLTPLQQAEATSLPVGYSGEYPFTWGRNPAWPAWCELPHQFRESDLRGNYTYGLAVYDWANPPENPDDWASQPLLDYALAIVGYSDMAHASGIPNLEHAILHHREQLDADDLDAAARNSIETGGFFLGLMTGFTDWISGCQLRFDSNGGLHMGPGYGWQFKELVIPNGQYVRTNPADPANPGMERSELRRYSSYPLLQTDPDLYIGSVADHEPPQTGVRYDVICVEAVAADEGAVRLPSGEYPETDKRLFVRPDQLGTDGRPRMETRNVATRRRMAISPSWERGLSDPFQTAALKFHGKTIVGYAAVSADGNHQIGMLPYPSATVQDHRSRTPIDHPDGSIGAKKLSAGLAGTWTEGADLNLRTMSRSIINARGGFSGPTGLDGRISTVIDADGQPVESAFAAGIDSALKDAFSNVLDARNNLLGAAIQAAISGKASYVRCMMGQVNDGAQLPRIPGFADEEQFAIVSIADLFYNFGAPTVKVWSNRIRCFIEGWVGRCFSECQIEVADQDDRLPITTAGTANYLVIGIRQLGT